jgi:DNA-directed RNA polymerase sigma subunit (sigma70/sigma32)
LAIDLPPTRNFWVRKEINDYINEGREKCGVDKNGNDKLSLDARIEDGEGGSAAHIDRLINGGAGTGAFWNDKSGPIPQPQEDKIIEREDDEIRRKAIATVLTGLSDRDREIFEARWLGDADARWSFSGRISPHTIAM